MVRKSRRKRVLIWVALVGVVISGIVGGGGWYLLGAAKQAKRHLADALLESPESAAVVSYTFDDTGARVEDGRALFYNADNPLVMASTMKVVVLAAYAEAVAGGDLDPGEPVPVGDLERYYLPMTDGGAHAMGLESLGLKTDAHGFARDASAEITLDDVARIMIHYSGNAETDYLIARLGVDSVASVMTRAGLEQHTPIRPLIGSMLAMFNHERASFSITEIREVIDEVSQGDTRYVDGLTELYARDPQWRASQIAFMSSLPDQGISDAD
ncbi:MAG: serine hydrolase, partial [Anaerolineae bacterium]|nr:serine hydrolase [Anaerolineae bacterium]